MIHVCGDQISHIQSTCMMAKTGLTNRSYPYVKKSLKRQQVRIPINPAILAAIVAASATSFHSRKKKDN